MNCKFILLMAAMAIVLAACSGAHATPVPTFTAEQAQGKSVFGAHCSQCHALVPGTIVVGPSLANIATRASTRVEGEDARAYIETSILSPGDYVVDGFQDIMPKSFGKDLTSDELDEVVSYLLTQK